MNRTVPRPVTVRAAADCDRLCDETRSFTSDAERIIAEAHQT